MSGTKIQPADPTARRVALAVVVVVAALGAAAVYAFTAGSDAVAAWLFEALSSQERRGRTLAGITTTLLAPLLVVAAWFAWLGGQIVAAGRFPPPGQRVIRDTPILEGHNARVRGQLLRVIAAMLAGGALLIAVILWRLAAMLG
jgi:hypothetical protein